MTLDDCDLPEVREYRNLAHEALYNRVVRRAIIDAADAALAALYQKWQEAQAECDRLRELVGEYKPEAHGD